MKVLKSEQEYVYTDFKALQCGMCKKKIWDKGQEIINIKRIQCPQCRTIYSFEPTHWRVLADVHKKEL